MGSISRSKMAELDECTDDGDDGIDDGDNERGDNERRWVWGLIIGESVSVIVVHGQGGL